MGCGFVNSKFVVLDNLENSESLLLLSPSCYRQNTNLNKNAGFQVVINAVIFLAIMIEI